MRCSTISTCVSMTTIAIVLHSHSKFRTKVSEQLHLLRRINIDSMKLNNQNNKLPNLLPFLGIAMKEPRLPPITLCGRRKGGFLKDPVYWWRNECILWDVGGLPFFTIGSIIRKGQNIHSHKQVSNSGTWQEEKKKKKKIVTRNGNCHFMNALFFQY